MNGYTIAAEAHKKILEREPAENTETIADLKRKINALEYLASIDDQTRCELFNSGAFNDTMRGYIKLALANTDTDKGQAAEIMREVNYLLDTKSAQEAEAYY